MVTLSGVLRELLDAGLTPDQAAEKVITRPDLADLVEGLIRQEATRLRRSVTRSIVQHIERKGTPPIVSPLQMREQLIERGFFLPPPDARYVTFLQATAEEHLARAGWQRDSALPLLADAEFHEACANTIRKFKVKCLADIPEAKRPKKDAA